MDILGIPVINHTSPLYMFIVSIVSDYEFFRRFTPNDRDLTYLYRDDVRPRFMRPSEIEELNAIPYSVRRKSEHGYYMFQSKEECDFFKQFGRYYTSRWTPYNSHPINEFTFDSLLETEDFVKAYSALFDVPKIDKIRYSNIAQFHKYRAMSNAKVDVEGCNDQHSIIELLVEPREDTEEKATAIGVEYNHELEWDYETLTIRMNAPEEELRTIFAYVKIMQLDLSHASVRLSANDINDFSQTTRIVKIIGAVKELFS